MRTIRLGRLDLRYTRLRRRVMRSGPGCGRWYLTLTLGRREFLAEWLSAEQLAARRAWYVWPGWHDYLRGTRALATTGSSRTLLLQDLTAGIRWWWKSHTR